MLVGIFRDLSTMVASALNDRDPPEMSEMLCHVPDIETDGPIGDDAELELARVRVRD